jgi:hypothetical protein
MWSNGVNDGNVKPDPFRVGEKDGQETPFSGRTGKSGQENGESRQKNCLFVAAVIDSAAVFPLKHHFHRKISVPPHRPHVFQRRVPHRTAH